MVLYSFVLVLKVFNACLTLFTSAVAWYSLVLKNEIELLCNGISHSTVSFLADREIVPPQSNKYWYLVSVSVQLEAQFLFLAPGCGFSLFDVLSLSLLGIELVEGEACGVGTWYGRTAGCQ